MALENDNNENLDIPLKTHRIGTIGVLRVCEELLGFGYTPFLIIDSRLDIGTDIMLQNKVALQVKTRASSLNRGTHKIRTIEYNLETIGRNDFLIIWILDYNFYVIPINVLPKTPNKNSIAITIGRKCKWDMYIDRWDLLGEPSLQPLDRLDSKDPHKHKLDEF